MINPYYISKPLGVYGIKINGQILAGMPRPRDNNQWQALYDQGIQNVVCLMDDKPWYDPAPLKLLTAVRLDDLVGNGFPTDEETEKVRIADVVDKVVKKIESGESVVIHCAGGTGRTGTVMGCVLRQMGYDAKSVFSVMDQINELRNGGWPESDWQRELIEGWL